MAGCRPRQRLTYLLRCRRQGISGGAGGHKGDGTGGEGPAEESPRDGEAGVSRAMSGVLRRLVGLTAASPGMAVVVYTTPVLGAAVAVAIPVLSAQVLDQAGAGRQESAVERLWVLAIAAVVLYLVSGVRSYCNVKLAFLGTHRVRIDMVAAALRRPDPPDQGSFAMRISQDADAVGACMAAIPNLVVSASTVAFIPVAMFTLSPLFAAMLIPLLGAVVYAVHCSATRTYPITWLLRRRRDAVAQGLSDALSDLEQVKGQRLGPHRRTELWRHLSDHASARQYLAQVEGRYLPLITTSPLALQAVVLIVGSALLARGNIGPGTLIGFVGLAALFVAPAQGLTGAIRKIQISRVSVERTFELIDSAPPTSADATRIKPPSALHVRVVGRSAAGDSPGLHVRPGERIAIIGGPGAGKSQLAAALLGLPNRGSHVCSVSMDGVEWYRPGAVAGLRLLTHDRWFFGGTLRQNITLGDDACSDTGIEGALDRVGCTAFLSKRQIVLDSPVDEHAAGLSGGERTRLALARAIAGHPALVVLDAPVSGLDPAQAREIQAALMLALPQSTIVWLDSQLPDPGAFDRVITLDDAPLRAAGSASVGCHGPYAGKGQDLPHTGWPSPATHRSSTAATLADEVERLAPGDSHHLLTCSSRYLPGAFPDFGHTDDQGLTVEGPAGVTPTRIAAQRFRGAWAGLVALAALETLTVIGLPWVLKVTLDEAISDGTSNRFLALSSIAMAALVVLLTVRVARTTSAARLEERLDRLLKKTLIEHVQVAPLRNVHTETIGEFLTSATHDTSAIARLSAQTLPTVAVNALIVILGFLSMLVADARLVGVVAAAFTLLVGFTLVFRRRSETLYARARTAESRMVTVVTETIRGHRYITAYRAAPWFTERAAATSLDLHATWLRAQRWIASYFPAIQLAANAALVALLAVTLSSPTPPAQSVPTIAFFITLLGLIASPIQSLAQSYDEYVIARVASTRLNATLLRADRSAVDDRPTSSGAAVHGPTPVLSAEDLLVGPPPARETAASADAAAPEQVWTLPAVRLDPGQWMAITGRSGTGKTTLLRILTGLFPAAGGTVRLFGERVTQDDERLLRAGCVYVPQSPALPPVTGLSTGIPSLDSHRSRLADPTDEREITPSHGEGQALALHHALIQQPRIAFLDEPLSVLDVSQSLAILTQVQRAYPTLSVVYATHSPELARLAHLTLDIDPLSSPAGLDGPGSV